MGVLERFIKYLENLEDKDWNVKVNTKWDVKDIVCHLVGWEEECAKILKESGKTGERAWFLKTEDYTEFNRKNIEKYSNYSPKRLLEKWKYFIGILEKEIEGIGKENLDKKHWVFDNSHYLQHFEQIKRALNKY